MHSNWGRVWKQFITPQSTTGPYSPWENECEAAIGKHKKWEWHIKQQFRIPESVWDYLSTIVAALQRSKVREDAEKTCLEEVMRVRPYISDFMDFHFYENVKFYRAAYYPTNVESFGKWLGPSNNMGSIICYVILKENGETTNCSTVRCLTVEESTLQTEK